MPRTPMPRRRATAPATALLLVAALLAPAALAGGGGPDQQHQTAEALCRHADAREMLLGSAAAAGFAPEAALVPAVDLDIDLASAIADLYAALGLPVTRPTLLALDARAAALGPEVARPIAVLVAALAEVARLNEAATAAAVAAHGRDVAAWPADAPVRTELQVAAAALLLDAVEAARPMVLAALEAGQWPRAGGIADPVGLVRVGGVGDDYEPSDRVLAVDPAGNDRYEGRVGGADLGGYLAPPFVGVPVGLAWDLAGDDAYAVRNVFGSLGGGAGGLGVLVDDAGDDAYAPRQVLSMGAGERGVGLLLEGGGADAYRPIGGPTLGYAQVQALGLAVELAGDDAYVAGDRALGHSMGIGGNGHLVGSFCDRAGTDSYYASSRSVGASDNALTNAWFADVGGTADAYGGPAAAHAGNARYWTHGHNGGVGRGLDA